jgi:hypothetical protein
MAKRLYFDETTITELISLPDALNRELHKNDFVTAVFSDGELTLFKVVGFESHKIDHFMDYSLLDHDQDKGVVLTRTDKNEYVVLSRVRGTNAFSNGNDKESQKLNSKLVFKTRKQVAYADTNYVMLHLLGA